MELDRQIAEVRAENARLHEALRAYDHAITMTPGEGGRRSWSMNAAKIARAFDLHRAALSRTPQTEGEGSREAK